jgi:hypothetical protein
LAKGPTEHRLQAQKKTIHVRRTTVKRLLTLGRLVPLLIALCAGGTYWLWNYRPELVSEFDNYLVKRYVRFHTKRLDRAEAIFWEDHEQGIEKLESFLAGLSSYRKGDRLANVAKKALLFLARAHARADNFQSAVAVLERYMKIDNKDLGVRAELLSYAIRLPESRPMAIVSMGKWNARFPESPIFSEPLAQLLAEEGALGDAWEVHQKSFHHARTNYWFMKWRRTGKEKTHPGMFANLVPRLDGDRLRLTFELEHQATRCKLVLPMFCYVEFRDLEVRLGRIGGSSWKAPKIEFGGFLHEDGAYRMITPDASIRIDELLAARKQFGFGPHEPALIHFEARVDFIPSLGMAFFAFHYREKLLALAAERNDPAMATTVHKWANYALRDDPVTLYWRSSKEEFGRARRLHGLVGGEAKGASREFTCEFTVDGTARYVRFDFPPRLGSSWQINSLAVETDGPSIDLAGTPPDQLIGLKLDSRKRAAGELPWYVVTGIDPYIVFKLSGETSVKRVTVTGEVR